MEDQSVGAGFEIGAGGDEFFDRHVLGRMLLQAAAEAEILNEPLSNRLGLDAATLSDCVDYLALGRVEDDGRLPAREPDEEEVMVRTLLQQNCSRMGPAGPWLAAIIARRALEPNHLWEDLGLARRADLSKLLLRHFPGLAEKNTRNMRWKKFLYRALCEAEGFTMCPSPTCDACPEFDLCYGDESGASALARNNRQARVAA